MEPKKKDLMDYAVWIIALCIGIYFALHMAVSYENVKNEPIIRDLGDGTYTENFDFVSFFQDLGTRLSTSPDDFRFVKSTFSFCGGAIFVWLLALGYYVTSQKKYINGKEYGTAEWCKPSQLADLKAANILKQETKKINKKKISKIEKEKMIADAKEKYTSDAETIFTKTERICMYNYKLNNNTIIIGGSGSGKTRGYVLPNLLNCNKGKYSPSVVVTDPKGEILGKVGKHLENCGYEIKVLNLKEQDRSFCFNPFVYIRESRYEEQIPSLVSSIMDSKREGQNNRTDDQFWNEMAKLLLKSIFFATYEGFPKEEQNITNVMQLFRWFEISENDDRYKNPTKLDIFFEEFGDKYGVSKLVTSIQCFYEFVNNNGYMDSIAHCINVSLKRREIMEEVGIPLLSNNSTNLDAYYSDIMEIVDKLKEENCFDEKVEQIYRKTIDEIQQYKLDRKTNYENSQKPTGVYIYEKYGDVNTNPALRSWEDFRTKCKGKTAQSVTATAIAALAPFDEKEIRRIFSKDEMELDLVGERKTALFIVLPPTKKDYNFIANVLYTQLFEQLEYCATVKHADIQRLPVSVKFILDEFYNTGKIASFENILSYARSFGIGITIILQSLDQIKEMYEKSWGTVMDNCSTLLYLGGIRNTEPLKFMSESLGKGTFDKKTTSVTKGKQSSTSTSHDKFGRELLDPSEIQRMDIKKCLLYITGYNPCFSMKFDYTSHKNYHSTSDYDNKNIYIYKTPEQVDKKDNVTHDDISSNNNEERKSKFTPKSFIEIVTEPDKILDYLNENVFNLEIESGEEVKIIEDDLEELELILQIEEQENALRKKQTEVFKKSRPLIKEPVIHELEEVAEEITSNVNEYEFITSNDEEEYEDDSLDRIKESLNVSIEAMFESMVSDGFAEELNKFDSEDIEIEESIQIETA